MLHVHSYNMGMAAGLAWKAAGKEHFYAGEATADSDQGKLILETLKLTEKMDMFMPSSYLEGFYNAFHRPYFINA